MALLTGSEGRLWDDGPTGISRASWTVGIACETYTLIILLTS